ncbi:6-phosphogluconolactonase [Corynebacterium terpenotabidum]|uniref:6-phosphogluconolactonase n=1 Tax=Corynebacterium terpenotabidum Y-11 TaxID=1200352 RepID=S4XGM7_9CORY|nr:6-phosphogluconolactonase [Corynebacterium terpenotabidum]AGP30805.1 6-phosphogluconolactonase [Corynebacterium terpenotabidum Y-11]
MSVAQCVTWPDQRSLVAGVARNIVDLLVDVQKHGGVGGASGNDGMARIVLTGGGAGIGVLAELAVLDHAATQTAETFPVDAVDWTRVHVFFGDERYVPADHPERNEGQADAALLDHVGIPADHVHRFPVPTPGEDPTGPGLDAAAGAYAATLAEFAPAGFDLHLLGMGPEGHINSLFPHTPELNSPEQVVAVRDCPKPPPERVSLTLSAISSARQVWMLVCGGSKREAAGHAVSGDDPAQWPAAGARGCVGTVVHVDAGADPR